MRDVPRSVSGYVLTSLIGRGSFGCVYLCQHFTTGEIACVKVEYLKKDRPDVPQMSQVAYEHRLYESLQHTGARGYVPRSLCYGEQPGQFRYMVMTLGGKDLMHVVRSYTKDEKLLVFANVLRALRAFHEAGLLHRDVKPRNILIKRGGCSTDILIVDLGLAKRYSAYGHHIENRHKATAVGTPRYASVNSQLFLENSRRDDLHSCVYTMVTVFGRHLPWEHLGKGDRASKLRETVRLKRLATPARVCRGCPPCLARVYTHVQQLAFAQRPDYEAYIALAHQYMSPAFVEQVASTRGGQYGHEDDEDEDDEGDDGDEDEDDDDEGDEDEDDQGEEEEDEQVDGADDHEQDQVNNKHIYSTEGAVHSDRTDLVRDTADSRNL